MGVIAVVLAVMRRGPRRLVDAVTSYAWLSVVAGGGAAAHRGVPGGHREPSR